MFKMSLKYAHSVFMLHFVRTLLHCELDKIVLLRRVFFINFDAVGCSSSYLLYCGRFCVPLGVLFSWLRVSSVASCTLYCHMAI
jgi:hypothetical protein